MPFDATATEPKLRPGERMLNGRPYVFDMDLVRLHEAHESVRANRDVDVSGLSYDDLTGLIYDCQHVIGPSRSNRMCIGYELDQVAAEALAHRLHAERATRPEYKAVFGKRSAA